MLRRSRNAVRPVRPTALRSSTRLRRSTRKQASGPWCGYPTPDPAKRGGEAETPRGLWNAGGRPRGRQDGAAGAVLAVANVVEAEAVEDDSVGSVVVLWRAGRSGLGRRKIRQYPDHPGRRKRIRMRGSGNAFLDSLRRKRMDREAVYRDANHRLKHVLKP